MGRPTARHILAVLLSAATVFLALSSLMPTPSITVAAATCEPRPPIRVSASDAGYGRLQATIAAGAGTVRLLRFTNTANAVIDIGSRSGITAPADYTPPAGSGTVSFVVRPLTMGKAATVSLVVTDDCGEWPTFVGAGHQVWAACQ